jgi:hypothetical protein
MTMATSKRPRRSTSRTPETEATNANVEPTVAPDTTAPAQPPESPPLAEQATPRAAPEPAAPDDTPTLAMSATPAGPAAATEEPPAVAPPSNAASVQTAQSLASERARLNGRRLGIIGAIGGAIGGAIALLIVIAGLVAYSRRDPVTPAALAPAAQTNPTTGVVSAPTPQPAADEAAASGTACAAIAGLPIYPNAPCIDQDTDEDDGAIKLENTYTSNASTSDIGRFYERAFAENGWTLQAFQYNANLGQRSLEVDVETASGASGPATKIKLTEKGPVAASTTCGAIAGLPSYPNATCVAFDSDQDDGLIKNEHTYTLSAAAEDVRRFYESALTQNGWAGQAFEYDVTQGQRRLTIAVDAHPEQSSAVTRFKIAEQ